MHSRYSSGSRSKKLVFVLIIEVCTSSSAQLYSCIVCFEVIRLVILIYTSQSIKNFLNCWDVISDDKFGGFVAILWEFGGDSVNNLPSLIRAKASPITVTPSSDCIVLSMMDRLRLSSVSF